MRALDPVDADIDTCPAWGPGVEVEADTPTKRRREPSSASAEEGYESVSDEEVKAAADADASEPPREAAAIGADNGHDHDDHHLTLFAARKLSASGADSEDSGLSRDGPPSLASSTASSSASSTAGAAGAASAGPGAPTDDVEETLVAATEQPGMASALAAIPPAAIPPAAVPAPAAASPPAASPPAAAAAAAGNGSGSGWERAVVEAKEQAFARLQDELKSAQQELLLRDEEVSRLSRIRDQVEAELEELTASLFQEAHNMVREANERQTAAERALAESSMQVEVLSAEVSALKTLVLTSTPSRPNAHLHPQIDQPSGSGLFRKHRRSPSHFNLKYGRENSPPDSPTKEPLDVCAAASQSLNCAVDRVDSMDGQEVEPNLHADFVLWRQHPTLDKADPFVGRVYREDILLCLQFNNSELAERVSHAVENGSIFIEAVGDRVKSSFPKRCALLDAPRQCHYRMKLGDQETWHSISQICRNRITAVIDFLNYLRYIERGLVKSSVHDVYWEIVRLRKEMCLARLGLPLSTSK